ncbi:MAG: arginase family protein [Planctomycetota bacterium]
MQSAITLGGSFAAVLAIGVAIGRGTGAPEPAAAAVPATAQEPAAPDLSGDVRLSGMPASMQPWRDPANPNVMLLSEGWDLNFKRRDPSAGPKREPGPMDLQRYSYTTQKCGFPTYFGLPFAMTTEDLKAGEIDVAIVGLPSNFNMGGDGTAWAANILRTAYSYDFCGVGHDTHLNLQYFDILKVVDYGNANHHVSLMNQNFTEHAVVLKEILDGGAIPMAIGGEHGTQVASIMAVVDHFGPKEIAFVHFDAHLDLAAPGAPTLGLFTHGGRARRYAYEQGWIKGEDMHSIGLHSPYDDPERIEWMREIGDQYHFMAEFEERGFETVWNEILAELKGKRLYVSVDVDFIDPAHVPGTSNPEPGGFTSKEAITMLRELSIQNEIVLIDFVEYSPLMDTRRLSSANCINRLMRAVLAGMAARRQGVTDPKYLAPELLSHK